MTRAEVGESEKTPQAKVNGGDEKQSPTQNRVGPFLNSW